jgi:hypothetical protein
MAVLPKAHASSANFSSCLIFSAIFFAVRLVFLGFGEQAGRFYSKIVNLAS